MTIYRYCTPEWLKESANRYRESPRYSEALKKLKVKVCFRIKAEPAWGIDKDIIFAAFIDHGKLIKLDFFSEADAFEEADFIMVATPQVWKKLLRNETKFVSAFMLGKITLDKGSSVGAVGLAPHAPTLVDALTQVDLQFPDEMSSDELEQYRTDIDIFRHQLGV